MPPLSIQLYSLRNHGPLAAQLDAVREAGFPAVETIQSLMEDAQGTRAMLDERGLTAPSGHVSMAAMRERPDWAIDAARVLGVETLIVPALHGQDRPTDAAGWRAVGAELGRIARRAGDEGLRFAFHNHHWEVQPLPDGSLPLDLLLDAGAADGLGWQAALAWLVRGGDDPGARLDRHRDRLASVHVKDIAPAGAAEDEDGWADVGHGVLDWADLWRRSNAGGASPLMVAEHDKPADAARFATRSFAAMERLAAEAGR